MVTLHVLAASPKLRFKTFLLLSTSLVIFHTSFILQYGLPDPFKHLDVLVSIVQELCESRSGRPGLSVLTSLLVSVDVKIY